MPTESQNLSDCAWCGGEIVGKPYPNKHREVFCSRSHRRASNNNLGSFQKGMKLVPEELEALREYEKVAGMQWRTALKKDWARATSSRVGINTYTILHKLLNRLGTTWLTKFRIPGKGN